MRRNPKKWRETRGEQSKEVEVEEDSDAESVRGEEAVRGDEWVGKGVRS